MDDYFGCVVDVIQMVREIGTASECLPPCEAIDYTAWQVKYGFSQNFKLPMKLGHESFTHKHYAFCNRRAGERR